MRYNMYSKVTLWGHLLVCALIIGLLDLTPTTGNQMNPHVFPSRGPFFEGWYVRLIDANQNASLGFLVTSVLPDHQRPEQNPSTNSSKSEKPLLCVSLVLSLEEGSKLDGPFECFDPKELSVHEDGKPVVKNPNDKNPPNFEIKVANNMSFTVTQTGTEFSVYIREHILRGKTIVPVPWGANGHGPESWLQRLPLPLHWFVYSLRSTVIDYSYTNTATGQVVQGGSDIHKLPVVAHLEKNWGESFPEAWIWAEGVNPANSVAFAFSAVRLHLAGSEMKIQMTGYRNPGRGIDCSFQPFNSFFTLEHDGCAGSVTLDVTGPNCHVVFKLNADPQTFSSCLVIPTVDGIEPGCMENYGAVAEITVNQPTSGVTDCQIIPMSALEFGGLFMCNGKCP